MPIEVLLVEDSPGDVRLTQEAFREANMRIHLHVATDGEIGIMATPLSFRVLPAALTVVVPSPRVAD